MAKKKFENPIIIGKEKLMNLANYKPPEFPKYVSSLINLLNRWAKGTGAKIVGQMSDLAVQCPYKDYDKWREWYLKNHPNSIDNAVKLIMGKLKESKTPP